MKHDTSVKILMANAQSRPNQRAITYLAQGEVEEAVWTYADLDRRARAIAVYLADQFSPQDHALLLFPPGPDFISAFFGCHYAGMIPVPVFPPGTNRNRDRLQLVSEDCGAVVSLGLERNLKQIRADGVGDTTNTALIATDSIPLDIADRWSYPPIDGNQLAFLQYTSGSTGSPKGVMVTQNHLIADSRFMSREWKHKPESVMVNWCPVFHDLGLVYGVMTPVYSGSHLVYMSHLDFLQQPLHWLKAIQNYEGTHTSAPNFCYDLCVTRIGDQAKEGLDLSSWQVTASSGEMVRPTTMKRFSQHFESCGFRAHTFSPAYGLAEATLFMTVSANGIPPVLKTIDGEALASKQAVEVPVDHPRAKEISGSGVVNYEGRLLIVDPNSLETLPEAQVGEIWAAGPTVTLGYWEKPEKTAKDFAAYTRDTKEGPFLRTGDMGFFMGEELFVTGRIKDIIIIRGNNYIPQDIEDSVERSHPALRPGCSAALSVEALDDERLVIVAEVKLRSMPNMEPDKIIARIRQAVAEQQGLQVFAIALIATGSMEKSSSGKIQHAQCKKKFLEGTLYAIGYWCLKSQQESGINHPILGSGHTSTEHLPLVVETTVEDGLEHQIKQHLEKALGIHGKGLDPSQPFARYGMDSASAVGLSGELAVLLDKPLPTTLLYDHPTLRALMRHLKAQPALSSVQPGNAPTVLFEPIAIIGLGCRFPAADHPASFWQLLITDTNAIAKAPSNRPGGNRGLGGYLSDVVGFDERLFGISPREAIQMDPQQRHLLETAYAALGDAGLASEDLEGSRTGVYIGVSSRDYERLQKGGSGATHAATGNAYSIMANRLSYSFDFKGPSLAIDTACSSSLVAVDTACHHLQSGRCELALAGGVSLMLDPAINDEFENARMLSPDGRCKTFDARADGYVRGEGSGIVVLKRLMEARAAGDPIQAIIRGSAVNQDGRSNGITAPNGPAQEAVIREALAKAELDPNQIHYFEAHGTGTPLGDPIELNAVQKVLGEGRADDQPCYIGSVKTNIGHLEAAAGVAGLIKTVLAMQHNRIPSHLNFEHLNPAIEAHPAIKIPTESVAWPDEKRLLAGVSSFGFGGTNAHVVLEKAFDETLMTKEQTKTGASPCLITLSSQTANGLVQLARELYEYQQHHPDLTLGDLSITLARGRTHHSHRLALATRERKTELDALQAFIGNQQHEALIHEVTGHTQKVAFLFPGQGAQYTGMAAALYHGESSVKACLDQCETILKGLGFSVLAHLLTEQDDPQIHQTGQAQLALFCYEYALAQWLIYMGIKPSSMVGHSIGEYVAACLANVFTLPEALALVAARATAMQQLPEGGAMLSVLAKQEEIDRYLHSENLSIAAKNSPQNTVISGPADELEELADKLTKAGIAIKRLKVSHAFHSKLMDPILDDFERKAASYSYREPTIPLYSNLHGGRMNAAPNAAYWREHLRETVQFQKCVEQMEQDGIELYLEIGPGRQLTTLMQDNTLKPCLATGKSGKRGSLVWDALARLYTKGITPNWKRLFAEKPYRRRSGIPIAPFDRRPHWLEAIRADKQGRARVLSCTSAMADPKTRALMEQLIIRYGTGARSLGQVTGKHFLYIAEDRRALCFFNRRGHTLMALDYTGPTSHYEAFFEELSSFCSDRDLELVILEEREERASLLVADGFTTTVAGVWQDVNLRTFTLQGNKMRRLRYAANSYAKQKDTVAERHQYGKDSVVDEEIVGIIADWGKDKGTVKPLADEIAAAIRVARMDRETWLIRQADRIDGVIMIHPCPARSGHLLDMEFYRKDAPLGCMEFGITHIIKTLEAEGGSVLSLGLTLGTKLTAHSGDDPELRALLAELYEQKVLNGDANLQFKNKFRPDTQAVFLCRRIGLDTRYFPEVLQMLADPTNISNPDAGQGLCNDADESESLRDSPTSLVQQQLNVAGPIKIFQATISANSPAYLASHAFDGHRVFPAAGYIELALAAMAKSRVRLTDFVIQAALELTEGRRVNLQTNIADSGKQLEFYAAEPSQDWKLHARCRQEEGTEEVPSFTISRDNLTEELNVTDFYNELYAHGYQYGPSFQEVTALWCGEGEILGLVEGSPSQDHLLEEHIFAPPLLDGCIQVCIPLLELSTARYLPVGFDSFELYRSPDRQLWARARLVGRTTETRVIDLEISDGQGRGVAHFSQLLFKRVPDIIFTYAPPDYHVLKWKVKEMSAGPGHGHDDWLIVGENPYMTALAASQTARICHRAAPDKQELTQALGEVRGRHPHIVYMPACGTEDKAAQTARVCRETLAVIQALLTASIPGARLWIVTNQALAIDQTSDELELSQAALWGLARVFANEHPEHWGGIIDFHQTDPEVAASLIDQEMRREGSDRFIAYSGTERRVPRLIKIDPVETDALKVEPDATYMITGGLGALGSQAAEYLVAKGARYLALLSRSPADSEREKWLAALAERGVQVATPQADVAQLPQLEAAFAMIAQSLPPLKGIIHAAGVLDDGILASQNEERFQTVMAPKVSGTLNLHQATSDMTLDWLILYSSMTTVMGTPGQANYAAANAFMNSFAHWRTQQGAPTYSVNWGPWSGAGMASQTKVTSEQWKQMGIGMLSPEAGLKALTLLPGLETSAVGVFTLDVEAARKASRFNNQAMLPTYTSENAGMLDKQAGLTRNQLAQASQEEQTALAQAYLQEHAAAVLGMKPSELQSDVCLDELGMDSLMAMELRGTIQSELAINISVVQLFDRPTVEKLVTLMLTQFNQQPATQQPDPPPAAVDNQATGTVDTLSDQDVDSMLAQLLAEKQSGS